MRRDYEQHLVECAHCLSRQRLHRTIDVALIGLSTVSIAAFLLGLAVIHHVQPLQHWALVNLHLWQMSIVLIAVATPAPVYIAEVAMAQARVLQDRIPEELRERLMRNVA
jgi:hypothetical protein